MKYHWGEALIIFRLHNNSFLYTSLTYSESFFFQDREFLHPLQLQSFSVPVLPSKKKTEDKESSIDHHPSQVSKCEVNQRIKEANKTWRKNYEVIKQKICSLLLKASFKSHFWDNLIFQTRLRKILLHLPIH